MNDPGMKFRPECQEVLNELEELTLGERRVESASALGEMLTEGAKRHARHCGECEAALEDYATTREALLAMKGEPPEAGPWFAARVMAAVRSAEDEIEAKKESVWISVRGLAPRLAAFAGLLLVLGGTWAMELRHQEATARVPEVRPAEGLFESMPVAVSNDDIVASAAEESRR